MASLAYEKNADLAFNTVEMRNNGAKYTEIATELRGMAKKLDACLTQLKDDGWTTPAGSAFQKMAETNWEENIDKYADLLDTLRTIIDTATAQYDDLVTNYVEPTKL